MKPKPSLTNIEPPAVRKLAEKLWTIGYKAKCKALRKQQSRLICRGKTPAETFHN